jgi:hypothetical protein
VLVVGALVSAPREELLKARAHAYDGCSSLENKRSGDQEFVSS